MYLSIVNTIIDKNILLCPRQESDLDLELRRFLFYPLNYEDAFHLDVIL